MRAVVGLDPPGAGARRGADPGGDPAWARPRLVVSACLQSERCRFDGQAAPARFLPRLEPHVEMVSVCPEVEIGLGVPRPPIRLVLSDGETRVRQPGTGRDVTEAMDGFSDRFLADLGPVDGFLLKSRSPSCGPRDVKTYGESGVPHGARMPGRFAVAAAQRFPLVPMEDEGRLTNYGLRHHFLSRLFQTARLRELPPTMAELVRFHASNKMLLLAHSEEGMRVLGRLIANPERLPAEEVKRAYADEFSLALAIPARTGPVVNTLLHGFGHFSKELVAAEKRVFLSMVTDYRQNRGSLEGPLALLRGWIARHDTGWLGAQTFFEPYPAALHDLANSAGAARVA